MGAKTLLDLTISDPQLICWRLADSPFRWYVPPVTGSRGSRFSLWRWSLLSEVSHTGCFLASLRSDYAWSVPKVPGKKKWGGGDAIVR